MPSPGAAILLVPGLCKRRLGSGRRLARQQLLLLACWVRSGSGAAAPSAPPPAYRLAACAHRTAHCAALPAHGCTPRTAWRAGAARWVAAVGWFNTAALRCRTRSLRPHCNMACNRRPNVVGLCGHTSLPATTHLLHYFIAPLGSRPPRFKRLGFMCHLHCPSLSPLMHATAFHSCHGTFCYSLLPQNF